MYVKHFVLSSLFCLNFCPKKSSHDEILLVGSIRKISASVKKSEVSRGFAAGRILFKIRNIVNRSAEALKRTSPFLSLSLTANFLAGYDTRLLPVSILLLLPRTWSIQSTKVPCNKIVRYDALVRTIPALTLFRLRTSIAKSGIFRRKLLPRIFSIDPAD